MTKDLRYYAFSAPWYHLAAAAILKGLEVDNNRTEE